MGYQVKPVRTPGEWADFLELPFSLYKDDPLWVAPLRSEVTKALDSDSNPYFRGVALEKFVCYRDGQPVSRSIAVVSPRHWERFGEKAAFFGFFESENDPEAVCQLFAAIETYSTAKGARTLKGPFNPNHYSELGLLVENFETPAFFEPYNPVWYADLLRAAGFRAVTRLHTRVIRDTTALETKAKRLEEIVQRARKAGYSIRPFRLLHIPSELERIREIYNDAFDGNWHFLPLSKEEYRYSANAMFLITNPSLVQFIEYKGKPVGVLHLVLNINPVLQALQGRLRPSSLFYFLRKRFFIDEVVLYAVGIKKDFQRTAAIHCFVWAFCRTAQRFKTAYCTWMTEGNKSAIQSAESVGFEPYKWFDIFEKQLKDHS
ncbi:MAG: hypothetical protein ACOYOD_05455 [Saprospiraceae bacterium]